MKNLLKSIKFWEIIFIILSILLASPLFMEYLLLAAVPLAVIGMIPSILAAKKKNFYVVILNVLILIGLVAFYFYAW